MATQLELKLQQHETSSSLLANRVDELLRMADPRMDTFMKQTEERIVAEFLPSILHTILKTQEESVVQRLNPRLDPMLRLVDEIYKVAVGGGQSELTQLKR